MNSYKKLRWLPLVALASFGLSCGNPTEVVVFVDTTLGVPCQVDTFVITVEGDESVSREIPAADGQVSLTFFKGGGGDAFTIRAAALKGEVVIANAIAQATFEPYASQSLNIVLDERCQETPCDLSSQIEGFRLSSPSTREVCVEKPSRYTFQDLTGLANIVDACESQAGPFESLGRLDNDEVEISDGSITDVLTEDFDFEFYGDRVSRVWVSDDGYLTFGDEPINATFDRVTNTEGLTSPGHPERGVAPFWENIAFHPTGEACAALVQSGGRDTLWVTWKNACLGPACAPTDQIQFSVGLEEETDRITVGLTRMESTTEPDRAAGAQAVVGVIGAGEPACAADECSLDGFCADGETPCGFTQVFSRTQQTDGWPATYVFEPVNP